MTKDSQLTNSSFADRRADREARDASGDTPEPTRRQGGFRAGIDAENPLLVVTHVQA